MRTKPNGGLRLRVFAALSAVVGVAAMAGPAVAAPLMVSATVGPVVVPGVPVNICVNDGTLTCTPTLPATSFALTVSATINPDALTAPTVTPGACSNGQGVALVVTTGSAGTIISGSVTVTVSGTPTVIPLMLPAAPANQTVIISACVAPGVGVPGLPGLPTLPGLPGIPGVPAMPGIPGLPVLGLPV